MIRKALILAVLLALPFAFTDTASGSGFQKRSYDCHHALGKLIITSWFIIGEFGHECEGSSSPITVEVEGEQEVCTFEIVKGSSDFCKSKLKVTRWRERIGFCGGGFPHIHRDDTVNVRVPRSGLCSESNVPLTPEEEENTDPRD